MNASTPPEPRSTRIVLGVVVGVIVGFIIGAAAYFLLSPWLETRTGLLREMQGFAFNLVPGLALIGGGLGAWWGLRRG